MLRHGVAKLVHYGTILQLGYWRWALLSISVSKRRWPCDRPSYFVPGFPSLTVPRVFRRMVVVGVEGR